MVVGERQHLVDVAEDVPGRRDVEQRHPACTASGWSSTSRCATRAPRSWPTTAYDAMAELAISPAWSAAIARLEYARWLRVGRRAVAGAVPTQVAAPRPCATRPAPERPGATSHRSPGSRGAAARAVRPADPRVDEDAVDVDVDGSKPSNTAAWYPVRSASARMVASSAATSSARSAARTSSITRTGSRSGTSAQPTRPNRSTTRLAPLLSSATPASSGTRWLPVRRLGRGRRAVVLGDPEATGLVAAAAEHRARLVQHSPRARVSPAPAR